MGFYKCKIYRTELWRQVEFANLSFQCDPSTQFTCWNGVCIPLSKRCDENMDCQDDSDEHSCGLIKLNPDKYRNAYMPNSPSVNDTLLIEVDFGVKDIVDINEPGV